MSHCFYLLNMNKWRGYIKFCFPFHKLNQPSLLHDFSLGHWPRRTSFKSVRPWWNGLTMLVFCLRRHQKYNTHRDKVKKLQILRTEVIPWGHLFVSYFRWQGEFILRVLGESRIRGQCYFLFLSFFVNACSDQLIRYEDNHKGFRAELCVTHREPWWMNIFLLERVLFKLRLEVIISVLDFKHTGIRYKTHCVWTPQNYNVIVRF